MLYDNEVNIVMSAKSQNEAFARIAVAAFVAPLDPTIGDVADVKTAVSEAVTNAIIHGYENTGGDVTMIMRLKDREIAIDVIDQGVGISDIERAMTPLYTSKPELERSGMGFTVMSSFMDYIDVASELGKGTKVTMRKRFG